MKLLRYLLRNPVSLIGVLILLAFVLVAIFAPVLAPPQEFQMSVYDTPRAGFLATPQPPSAEAIFGTTEGQYDIYYAVIWGTRTAFKIGLGVVAISVLIGTLIGSVAAYYGGAVDEILMRIVDVFMAVPFLIAAMVLTALLGKGIGPITIALTTFGWMGYARVIRSEILRIREMDYVHAARSYGAGDLRLIALHILPNAFFPVLVLATMATGSMVLSASALSFLGVGTEEGYADWGQFIAYSRNWIVGQPGNPFQYWYTLVFPGAAIFLFVLSWNLVGDALRDVLDPRHSS
ncbi:ABC transporter permease [Brucella intermedia]|jgi:peptide/nickel transport system permease protein|uniref:ABC transporter permease n=3 Tax=Brucella intermedia TaxID=94625 RepID=A0A5N7NTQ7_9HYPH|nr:ABC transporter permease [Brucella intermedia]KAB2668574.1 ABC transporter permease [Ochrobactrum sp. LMG 5442]PJR93136.1 ABC transporter permease [Ochrobactrum sp. 721/2009]PJT15323.1 ABC transporter permease [Ochrobactrum sp. 720/2009]PJT23279.1 ABC transporter permease [Ochrobactrum sp. 715/2009]PJT24923.1 ABC transporter permease [Ochrobactrum sp. 30A/1000/2015]PJT25409.1 ABC transporter permease [Ochrobactrum sp. 695/2009]PJT32607.1 ABC transporter permease [Ochrobactrum sp. 689/2009